MSIALCLTSLMTLQPLPGPAAGGIVLDVDGARMLVGRPLPAPDRADPALRMRVTLLVDGRPTAWPIAGTPVASARLAGARALVVTPGGELLEVPLAGGAPHAVDTRVTGPLGATPDGSAVVYCKGDMPDFEVWRRDRGAAPRPLTADMAPTWSPTISADGRTVVFVSSRSGVPALWRTDGAGPPRQLTSREVVSEPGRAPAAEPFPAALTAPVMIGDRLAFEAHAGVYVVTLEGAPTRTLLGATAPHRWPDGALGVVQGGALRRVER